MSFTDIFVDKLASYLAAIVAVMAAICGLVIIYFIFFTFNSIIRKLTGQPPLNRPSQGEEDENA